MNRRFHGYSGSHGQTVAGNKERQKAQGERVYSEEEDSSLQASSVLMAKRRAHTRHLRTGKIVHVGPSYSTNPNRPPGDLGSYGSLSKMQVPLTKWRDWRRGH